jgi:hypothetical protein
MEKTMRITLLAAGFLALTAAAAGAQDCHLQQYASISFTRTEHGLVLPVKIGDTKRDLVFDLGDASNALNSTTAHDLGLRITTLASNVHVHRGRTDIHYTTRAPRVIIDGNGFDNVDFLVLPVGAEGDAPGAIGTRLLEHADIELDMAGGKLNLFSDSHCPGQAVYWTSTGFVKVPLEIDEHDYIRLTLQLDGKPVNFALNTEGGSVIGMNAMRRIFSLDASSPGMTLDHTAPNGVKYYRYTFQKLETDGLAINHPAILVRDEPDRPGCITGQHLIPTMGQAQIDALHSTSCYGQADGTLGLSVLSKLHLYVSKKEKLLYVTGAGAH